MIRKIISCGQTGVELAALDTAIKLGLAHGGWTSRGRRNDEGRLPDIYILSETSSLGFHDAVEKNVYESDGTLVISRGVQTAVAAKAVQTALKYQRQFLHVDLNQYALFEAASLSCSWMSQRQVKSVFITGPAAGDEPEIYGQVRKLLETAFYLAFVKSNLQAPHPPQRLQTDAYGPADQPGSVAEAVLRLKNSLTLKDRILLANMQPDELDHLNSGLAEYIKKYFGLYTDNENLMQSCAAKGRLTQPLPDEACAVIIRALWEDLRQTHKLRIVK